MINQKHKFLDEVGIQLVDDKYTKLSKDELTSIKDEYGVDIREIEELEKNMIALLYERLRMLFEVKTKNNPLLEITELDRVVILLGKIETYFDLINKDTDKESRFTRQSKHKLERVLVTDIWKDWLNISSYTT